MILNNNSYSVSDEIILKNGAIPLTWWVIAPNFGDLLSPYLISKLTNLPVSLITLTDQKEIFKNVKQNVFSYLAIGSIISKARNNSVIWGSGAFGTEIENNLNKQAKYLAVRGPLTRNLLRIYNIECPSVYGDPALLLPYVFNPKIEKKYETGIIFRWSEEYFNDLKVEENVKKIFLRSDCVEKTLTDILQCKTILSSSLHGLIVADAYNIPSAWLSTNSAKGLEFKFYDYFLSVNKYQQPQNINLSLTQKPLNSSFFKDNIDYNDKPINYNAEQLFDACPFLKKHKNKLNNVYEF